jgi:hypothetical protein
MHMVYYKVKKDSDGAWMWFRSQDDYDYIITGKYLFFSSDYQKLIDIAINEIRNHGFHKAKVNITLLEGQTDHVLCLYYKDDSRKDELAERNNQEYKVKYRYWKSDEATLRGHYSKEFLDKLNEPDKKYFTEDKLASD